MKAVWYDRQGPAEEVLQYGDQPDPVAGPGELLIRISGSAVSPTDCNGRSGRLGRKMVGPRVIPNSDGSGTVVAVGSGVAEEWIGKRVWIYSSQRYSAFGTAAQYSAVPEEWVSELPANTDFRAGAGLGIPALTAWVCLFADGPIEGRTVLVTGGAGGVGHYAVQLARRGGARVIATVSGDDKAKLAHEAGAHEVINYRREPVAERVLQLTDGAGVDRIVEVDLAANLAAASQVMKHNGVIAAYASMSDTEPKIPIYPLMARSVSLHLVLLPTMPAALRRRGKEDITAWLASGTAQHRIAATFSLQDTAHAHQAVEAGVKQGVVVIDVP